MKIVKAREAVARKGLKILVYGPAGAGKTTLATTTGDMERTLILSAEAGLLSIQNVDIDVVEIESFADLEEALRELRAGRLPYTWVVIDSVTDIARAVLRNNKDRTKDIRRAYGDMADRIYNILVDFRDLPLNVVFLAQESEREDDGQILRRPSFPGRSLEGDTPYLMDEVFALRVSRSKTKGVRRALQTQPDGVWTAKDRSGVLDMFEEPDLAHIAQKIRASTGHASTLEEREEAQENATERRSKDDGAMDGARAREGAPSLGGDPEWLERVHELYALGEDAVSEARANTFVDLYTELMGQERLDDVEAQKIAAMCRKLRAMNNEARKEYIVGVLQKHELDPEAEAGEEEAPTAPPDYHEQEETRDAWNKAKNAWWASVRGAGLDEEEAQQWHDHWCAANGAVDEDGVPTLRRASPQILWALTRELKKIEEPAEAMRGKMVAAGGGEERQAS